MDIYFIVRALVENGFNGYLRPDHGRNIWGENAKPGYGLFDRALLYNEDGTPTARTGKILAATPMKKFGEISAL